MKEYNVTGKKIYNPAFTFSNGNGAVVNSKGNWKQKPHTDNVSRKSIVHSV